MKRTRILKLSNDRGRSYGGVPYAASVEITIKVNTDNLMRDEVEKLLDEASNDTMKMMAGLRYVGGGVLHRIKIK